MSKKQTDEESDSIMARIVAALEKLEARQREEVEPEEEEEEQLMEIADTSPALLKLRRLRPVIEASGDRRAIDAYNTAVRTLRRQAKERSSLVVADNFNYRPQRGNEADHEAARRFEDSARRARRLARNEPEAVEEPQTAHAEDATARDEDEAWGRRMMREGKRRRGETEAVPESRPRVTRQIEDSDESFEDVCARRREQLRSS